MVNSQKYLDKKYSKEERKNIKKLDISDKDLEGYLDLTDFVNLEELRCSDNKLTSINLNNNRKIEFIDCSDNLLTDIDFSHQDYQKLQGVMIENNNLSLRDLSCFSRFIKLENLFLGTDDEEKLEQNIYNRFFGSLEYLKNLNVLVRLDISGTDINHGLEYLPSFNLQEFYCSSERKGAKVEKIKKILKLSEEEAASGDDLDNREKIDKITAYQTFFIRRQTRVLVQWTRNNFLQSLRKHLLAIKWVKHKVNWGDLHFFLVFHEEALHMKIVFPQFIQITEDKIRKVKRELIEDFEELTLGEIGKICQTQTECIKASNFLFRAEQQQQETEALIQIHPALLNQRP